MNDRPRTSTDPKDDVAQTEAGKVAQPDSGAAGESLVDRSAEKADPTV